MTMEKSCSIQLTSLYSTKHQRQLLSPLLYTRVQKKPPKKRTVMGRSTRAEETFGRETSYSLNDYFLARGFAVVYAAGIGTKGSDGFRTCGDFAETSSTIAIIEWLTGKRKAFTNRTENIELKAWWCNKKSR